MARLSASSPRRPAPRKRRRYIVCVTTRQRLCHHVATTRSPGLLLAARRRCNEGRRQLRLADTRTTLTVYADLETALARALEPLHRRCVPSGCEREGRRRCEMVLLDALVPGGRLTSFSDSRKISLDGQPIAYELVELVAEAVSKDRVVDGPPAPFYRRDWVMLESRLPVVPLVRSRCEVPRAVGTEALGHPARHLRDVTKLSSFDELAFDAQ
jgi:hypothetical protein